MHRRYFLSIVGGSALAACHPSITSGAAEASSEGIEIAGDRRVARLPFQLIDNRIFVEARINGVGPFAMIFDTGGANIITPEAARRLGLGLRDRFSTNGVGEAEQPAWRTRIAQAALGDIRMADLDFTVLSLEDIRRAIGFDRLDGLVGHELLRRFIVRIDYDRSELVFAEPSAAPAAWFSGTELAFEFVENLPRVRARVDGLDIRAIIDTGDRSSLTLFGPFVADHGLRERGDPALRAVTGWGVGGPVPADVRRSGLLELSGFALRNVTTRMPLTQSGAFASRFADANIGNGVLKRFAVTFDYGRQRLFLEPGAGIDAPDPFDRSGMWLRLTGADAAEIEVFDVTPASPAAAAGLRAGDRIVALDGAAVSAHGLINLRQRLSAASSGSSFNIRVVRASGALETALHL